MDLSQLTIGEQLGSGGQGRVFLAVAKGGQRLALKIVEAKTSADPSERLAALRTDDLSGPTVPVLARASVREVPAALRQQLRGALPAEGVVLVMPFVAGVTLAQLRAEAPLQPIEAIAALAAIAARLARFAPGVAHGDLRPSNVLVQPNGEVVLLDPDLFRVPSPAEDARALGDLGRELLTEPPSGALAALLTDLGHEARPPSPPETSDRLGAIAQSLGAGTGTLGLQLATRVAPLAKHVETAVVAEEGRVLAKGRAKRNWRVARWSTAVLGAFFLIPVPVNWFLHGLVSETVVVPDEILKGAGQERLYIQADPGAVHYAEELHQLSFDEQAAAEDGVVQLKIDEDVPRVAILSAREEVLWQKEQPAAGQGFNFDVKPGIYFIEIDRPSGQIDRRPVRIDVKHPFRYLVTQRAYNAPTPHPPPQWRWFWGIRKA